MTTLTQMREAAALLQPDDPVRKALIWADIDRARAKHNTSGQKPDDTVDFLRGMMGMK